MKVGINYANCISFAGSRGEIRLGSEVRIHTSDRHEHRRLGTTGDLGLCSRMDLFRSPGATRPAQFCLPVEPPRISGVFDKAFARLDKYDYNIKVQSCWSYSAKLQSFVLMPRVIFLRSSSSREASFPAVSAHLGRANLAGDCSARMFEHQHSRAIVDVEHAVSLPVYRAV